MNEPKYLIKFCRELDHAELLVSGCLYMRPASSYHDFEQKFGDMREAGVIDSKMIFKNPNCYIYCMTAVFDNGGICTLNKKLISRFECENGYLVIIRFNEFIDLLKEKASKVFSGYECSFGFVKYRNRDLSFTQEALLSKAFDSSLYTKNTSFSIESEFRIATCEQFSDFPIDENRVLDPSFDVGKVYKKFYFDNDLRSISVVVPVKDVKDKIFLGKWKPITML